MRDIAAVFALLKSESCGLLTLALDEHGSAVNEEKRVGDSSKQLPLATICCKRF